jgi:hypothetical protein
VAVPADLEWRREITTIPLGQLRRPLTGASFGSPLDDPEYISTVGAVFKGTSSDWDKVGHFVAPFLSRIPRMGSHLACPGQVGGLDREPLSMQIEV